MTDTAIHFGAGNIGRGFIGLSLFENGYSVTFVDVQDKIIEALKKSHQYTVHYADDTTTPTLVTGVTGINSSTNEIDVVDLVCDAEVITTAVGPNVLQVVAKTIAKGIKKRNDLKVNRPLLIMACENMIDATTYLENAIETELNDSEKYYNDSWISYANTAVDRIIPIQDNDALLDVEVEPFNEWVIDKTALKHEFRNINGVHYVDNLSAYIERKLFTVNTGHAMAAYLGHLYGHTSMNAAIHDERVQYAVRAALNETGALLVKKYGFEYKKHQEYIETTIQRFKNPKLSDQVVRVARSPLRKLGPQDRLVKPARQYVEAFNETPKALAEAIASVLLFDHPDDEESKRLKEMIAQHGVEKAIQLFTGIESFSILFDTVRKSYAQLQ